MIFDIDPNIAIEAISQALEESGIKLTYEQFDKIVEAINKNMPEVIDVLTYGIQEHWKMEVEQTSRWGKQYSQAIKAKSEGNEGHIYLDEDTTAKGTAITNYIFAMMVESGVKSWSIKDALLASDKVKLSSEGIRYMVVPFPVAVPRKKDQGTMQSRFGRREMTKEMYNIVKGGGSLKSGSIMAYGKEMDVSGLSKWTTKQFHEGYGIFRAVSENSSGWQYPNIEKEPVYPSVLEEVNKRIYDVMTAFCKAVVEKYSRV